MIILEDVSLRQLRKEVSGITQKSSLERDLTDTNESKLIEVKWDEYKDNISVYFYVYPTKTEDSSRVKVLTPSAKEYEGTFYNVSFVFSNANDWLGEKDFFLNNPNLSLFREFIFNTSVKVHSNDPSFYYQGVWEDLSLNDGTIFKFPGPKGNKVWRDRHRMSGNLGNATLRITKHINELINSSNFSKQILKKLIVS